MRIKIIIETVREVMSAGW